VLSGGGQNGAYGAGLLKGWSDCSVRPRPVFDVVTGISTGALISTFVFLGTPGDDEALEKAYTSVTKADIFRYRCPLAVPFTDSVASVEPLKHLIATFITQATIERVAEAGATGRQLFVATVDLDKGALKPWNLTELAASNRPDKLARYRQIILAATAIPVLFPPVIIDGTMHVDGGAREQLFLREVVKAAYVASIGPSDEVSLQARRRSTIYIIVNGKVGVEQHCVKDGILPIASRSIEVLLDEAAVGDLFRVWALAKELDFGYLVNSIPDNFALPSSSYEFDQQVMRALFKAGRKAGRLFEGWRDKPPTASDAEKIKVLAETLRARS
jgi:predicted acylesterase/phospholipase RssA